MARVACLTALCLLIAVSDGVVPADGACMRVHRTLIRLELPSPSPLTPTTSPIWQADAYRGGARGGRRVRWRHVAQAHVDGLIWQCHHGRRRVALTSDEGGGEAA
jgi:hypothetical protein